MAGFGLPDDSFHVVVVVGDVVVPAGVFARKTFFDQAAIGSGGGVCVVDVVYSEAFFCSVSFFGAYGDVAKGVSAYPCAFSAGGSGVSDDGLDFTGEGVACFQIGTIYCVGVGSEFGFGDGVGGEAGGDGGFRFFSGSLDVDKGVGVGAFPAFDEGQVSSLFRNGEGVEVVKVIRCQGISCGNVDVFSRAGGFVFIGLSLNGPCFYGGRVCGDFEEVDGFVIFSDIFRGIPPDGEAVFVELFTIHQAIPATPYLAKGAGAFTHGHVDVVLDFGQGRRAGFSIVVDDPEVVFPLFFGHPFAFGQFDGDGFACVGGIADGCSVAQDFFVAEGVEGDAGAVFFVDGYFIEAFGVDYGAVYGGAFVSLCEVGEAGVAVLGDDGYLEGVF